MISGAAPPSRSSGSKPSPSTTVRVDRTTHNRIKALAEVLGTSDGEALSRAVRLMFQTVAADQLVAAELTEEEEAWLAADAG